MTAPLGVAANMRAWAGEIEQLLPPLATGDLRDVNDSLSDMVFSTGTEPVSDIETPMAA